MAAIIENKSVPQGILEFIFAFISVQAHTSKIKGISKR